MFSFSQINLFCQCKKLFKEKYLLGLKEEPSSAQEFGKMAHSLVKDLSNFNENLFPSEVVQCVKALRENEIFKKYKILEYEKCVKGNIGEYPFIAFLDSVAEDEQGNKVIFEYKFVKSLSSWKVQDNALQNSVYSLLTELPVIYFIIDKCKKTKIQVIKDPSMVDSEAIRDICRDILQEFEFIPKPSDKCFWCPLRELNCEAHF